MWKKVKNWKELPQGDWLVKLDNNSYEVAHVNPRYAVIGGKFAFDARVVIAYREIPDEEAALQYGF